MEKNFDFKRAEAQINEKWINGNMFRADVNPNKKPFTVIMPPPNVTSKLHIGHAFEQTIIDALVRFKRMQGYEALFLPGADHAAIATEVKVVEELRKQGIEKSSLTKEQFLRHVHKWYDIYKGEIADQMKRLGLSCDWSRFSFTMDERATRAVKKVFHNLHDKGLIYQGERMVNYCTTCVTAVSDAEVEHVTKAQKIYTIRFGNIDIATVRPEAIFSAYAIAVNPKDKRYTKLIGTNATIPFINIQIPIVADDCAEMKFGTGAVQMTAHSTQSYEFNSRHNFAQVPVINQQGIMYGDRAGEFAGMSVQEARKAVVLKLKEHGLLVAEKNHKSNVGTCYRCHHDIEPFMSKQWFMKMEELAKPAIEVLKNKESTILPKKFEKTYLHWLNNIKDWCISRQLTSGHKIPLDGVEDVLDTWFSSALWPFCTLGWPDKSVEYDYFYPTQVMIMGHEILFFWAIRMIFSGLEHTGKLPFDTLLFHGIVRDAQGRKMSKSLGNGIDPLQVIDEYGADALRFSLICGTKLDRDSRFSMDKVVLARNFINKIWNATKFFTSMAEQQNFDINDFKIWDDIKDGKDMSIADKWICTRLNAIIKSTTRKYEKYDFGVAANELQSFFWNDFCDWYLESIKVSPNKKISLAVFRHVLINFLKLIAPIMPFISEEIYCSVLGLGDSMLFANWSNVKNKDFTKERKQFDEIIEIVQTLRSQKKDNPEIESVVMLCPDWIIQQKDVIEKLSKITCAFTDNLQHIDIIVGSTNIMLNVNKDGTKARIAKEIEFLKKEISRGEKMLSNESFIAKAPKKLIDEEKSKLEQNKNSLELFMAGGKG